MRNINRSAVRRSVREIVGPNPPRLGSLVTVKNGDSVFPVSASRWMMRSIEVCGAENIATLRFGGIKL